MFLLQSILIAALIQAAPDMDNGGYLGGIVVRASDGEPVPGADVILSVRHGDEFLPMAKATADENGKFIFEDLPVMAHVVYKLGANWGGIHYPGPVAQLTPARSTVGVKLTVNEVVTEPSPLVARRHEITIRSRPGALEVSELIVIENPTLDCYVGKPIREGGESETLCLNIPSGFEQVTFDEEFFGRHFSLTDGRLVTGIPWTPGVEELRYSYVLPNKRRQRNWTRPLDLPCADMTVRIVTDKPGGVSCSPATQREEQADAVVFRYSGPEMGPGQEIHVELERLPVSQLVYAKWVAAALLALLVVAATISRRRQRGSTDADSSEDVTETHPPHSRTRGRKPRSVGSAD